MTSDTQMYKDRCHIFNYFFTNDISVTALCGQYGRSRYPGRIYQLIAIDTYSLINDNYKVSSTTIKIPNLLKM